MDRESRIAERLLMSSAKPFQVAWSRDKSLPHRKWDFVGTVWAESHKSAAYEVAEKLKVRGDIVETISSLGTYLVFRFADGVFIKVGFGT